MNCISCKKSLAEDIVIIGNQYPSAIFVENKKDDFVDNLKPSSLNVTKCTNEKCGLVQLSNKYDLDYVFKHYPYISGSTATMKSILRNVVDEATQRVSLCKDDVVLDIGGNDGTLLSLIHQSVKAKVNIDAATGIDQVLSDTDYLYVSSNRFSADIYNSLGLPNPKLIFSIAMFYHLNDPLEFCHNVYKIMDDDSVWVLQMTYLGTMICDNILDNIVHEHAAYYSLSSLGTLLSQIGLHIADAQIVNSYGGSIRIFVVKNCSQVPEKYWRKDYNKVQDFEIENQTNTYESLQAFNVRVQLLRKSIRAIIDHILQISHEPMWGFGASTKGNMLLQFLGLNEEHISCILDNNPKKIGMKTMGSWIPIVEESLHLNHLPIYLFVLPYYYIDAFVSIIQKHCDRPVHLFVPLPYPRFITVLPKRIHQ